MDENSSTPPPRLVHISRNTSLPLPQELILHGKSEFFVGRQPDVDLTLDSTRRKAMISRRHAKLCRVIEDNLLEWKLIDLKSLNGVFINDVKQEEAILRDGDVIVFGGGGNKKVGDRVPQADSEFRYQFRWANRKRTRVNEDAVAKMSRQDSLTPEERHQLDLKEELNQARREIQQAKQEMERQQREALAAQQIEQQKLQQRLEEERKHLEEEVTRQQQQLEQQQQELERFPEESAKLRSALEKHQMELAKREAELKESIRSSTEAQKRASELEIAAKQLQEESIQRGDIEDELTCTLCLELFFGAVTLECSHSFCKECIRGWLERKNECPNCRVPITKPPTPSVVLNNAVSRIVEKMDDTEKQARKDREQREAKAAKEREAKNRAAPPVPAPRPAPAPIAVPVPVPAHPPAVRPAPAPAVPAGAAADPVFQRLQTNINAARARGDQFMSIRDGWSHDERRMFTTGVGPYKRGPARALYCSITGLSPMWVQGAPLHQLRTAANNLSLPSTGSANDLRTRLNRFIAGT
eukprot:gnl/Trimastix_PCT/2400.p1 GENE.gnl/Trimastix_PCT/2400~~gnl/Trimastix_PCT/2400.p1  ORF type:complete len:527 (+),score=100.78 gnl/Trimastix_PCT/2400:35-1615(+)